MDLRQRSNVTFIRHLHFDRVPVFVYKLARPVFISFGEMWAISTSLQLCLACQLFRLFTFWSQFEEKQNKRKHCETHQWRELIKIGMFFPLSMNKCMDSGNWSTNELNKWQKVFATHIKQMDLLIKNSLFVSLNWKNVWFKTRSFSNWCYFGNWKHEILLFTFLKADKYSLNLDLWISIELKSSSRTWVMLHDIYVVFLEAEFAWIWMSQK